MIEPDHLRAPADESEPIGLPELRAAVAGAERVLDAGCGSGRLTLALAQAGADVTGIDTSSRRLHEAQERADAAGVRLRLLEADFNAPLPFPASAFDAAVSRLALMAAADPVAMLQELVRVLAVEGTVATAVWAPTSENVWFAAPRSAVAAVLGEGRGSFARAFGRLGQPGEAAELHRLAGFHEVVERRIQQVFDVPDAATHWARLSRQNGHFRRVDASLSDAERERVVADLEARLAPYRQGAALLLRRTLVLVTARR